MLPEVEGLTKKQKKIRDYLYTHLEDSVLEIASKFEVDVEEIYPLFKTLPLKKAIFIIQIYEANTHVTAKELAVILDKPYQQVARELKKAGIDIGERTRQFRKEKEEQVAQRILEMYEQNCYVSEMVEELGISHTKVKEIAEGMGLRLVDLRTKRQEDHIEYLYNARLLGVPYKAIAEQLGLSETYLLSLASSARAKGIPIPNIRDEAAKKETATE